MSKDNEAELGKIAKRTLAYKVLWNLEEIQAIILDLWEIDILEPWLEAVQRAEAQHDAVMLKHLALMISRQQYLWKGLAKIERKVRHARSGEYHEENQDE